jgi:hypothetical protein
LEEFEPTLNEIALAVGALSAVTGDRHTEALRVLRAMVDSFEEAGPSEQACKPGPA